MKILIGVDDSPHSDAAIEFVRKMTWPAGSRFIVASAVRPVTPIYSEVYAPAVDQTAELMDEQTKFHQSLASRGEEKLRVAGFNTEARVLQGDPREALIEAAKLDRVDMVVVGSHGRTGLAKVLMGSVAAHVVGHAPCNVLVVKLDVPKS